MQFFDSHAHLSAEDVFLEIDSILDRAKRVHVTRILNICTDRLTLQKGIVMSKQHPWIQNAGATTPHDVLSEGASAFPLFAEAARAGQLAAIGETGLDFYYQHSPRDVQIFYLKRYLELARETSLPVIFHCREAFADLFAIADDEYPKMAPAILHCFTGSMREAEEVLQRGWYLSLSGIVTFKKSEALRDVARLVPLSQLLLETDTPYLAPQNHRGKNNEPSFIIETARVVAEVKGISVEEVALATFQNGIALLGDKTSLPL